MGDDGTDKQECGRTGWSGGTCEAPRQNLALSAAEAHACTGTLHAPQRLSERRVSLLGEGWGTKVETKPKPNLGPVKAETSRVGSRGAARAAPRAVADVRAPRGGVTLTRGETERCITSQKIGR